MAVRVGLAPVAVLAATALCCLLAGCTDPVAEPSSSSPTFKLLRSASSDSGTAVTTGSLGEDTHGCVTVGRFVLIAGRAVQLSGDGSIAIGGQRYRQGDSITIAGGTSPAPPNSPCAAGSLYWQ